MPFTLAHPVAVLPLRRTRLVFSALVVGSLAPDFPYFFLFNERARIGHTFSGNFDFCLPAGLLVLWIFHAVVKRPLVSLSPAYMRQRISESDLEFNFGPWRRCFWILVSLWIGAATHVLWDGFTHDHGYFVKHWPLLRGHITSWIHIPTFKLLQFGCSVVGVGVLAWVFVWFWLRKPPVANPVAPGPTRRWRLLLWAVIQLIAVAVGLAVGYERLLHRQGWRHSLVEVVIFTITTINAEILIYSVFWHVRHRRKKQKPLHPSVQELEVSSKR